ncbi:MAG: methionine--tRNA ligase subunit beta [Candidatus Micrarchaeia archaeon]
MPEKISFEDFAKLDLRVGKILNVQEVEDSNKLYKLLVRVGTQEKTLVAGIAEHYAPDELLGKKIIVIANMKERKIKGVESQGMLLAAVPDSEEPPSKICLLTVDDQEMPDNSKIC